VQQLESESLIRPNKAVMAKNRIINEEKMGMKQAPYPSTKA
jgi:hypothetical protein